MNSFEPALTYAIAFKQAEQNWPNEWFRFILENLDKNWEWFGLSNHRNVTWDLIQTYRDLPWVRNGVAENPNITPEVIQARPDPIWDFTKHNNKKTNTTKNTKKTKPGAKQQQQPSTKCPRWRTEPDNPWDWETISKHPTITLEIILANPEKSWNWKYVSMNPNITCEIIRANPDKPWFWPNVSNNPNLTWEFVRENIDKDWCWTYVGRNPMNKSKEQFIRRDLQRWFSRSGLKEELMAKVWHPRNSHKFKYLDPEVFGGFAAEEGEEY